eukprot:m.9918 g.9918  ORF g.9918 m.9918 type:complete len:117 (-) comp5098_c0_seq1:530-880(-)
MSVVGEYYPPSDTRVRLAGLIQVVYIAVIVSVVFGARIFPALGLNTPPFIANMQDNPLVWCFVIYFVGNTIATNLLNTGAFEIFCNGQLVWSKLQQGRLPSVYELYERLDSILARD